MVNVFLVIKQAIEQQTYLRLLSDKMSLTIILNNDIDKWICLLWYIKIGYQFTTLLWNIYWNHLVIMEVRYYFLVQSWLKKFKMKIPSYKKNHFVGQVFFFQFVEVINTDSTHIRLIKFSHFFHWKENFLLKIFNILERKKGSSRRIPFVLLINSRRECKTTFSMKYSVWTAYSKHLEHMGPHFQGHIAMKLLSNHWKNIRPPFQWQFEIRLLSKILDPYNTQWQIFTGSSPNWGV